MIRIAAFPAARDLAAIQGLYKLVQEQQAEIDRLKEMMIANF